VIVDNGSNDTTPQIIDDFANAAPFPVRHLTEPQAGKSRALNAGVAVITSSVILFTDDDVRFPSNWIRAMCEPIISGQSEIVQGGIRWAPHLLTYCRNPRHAYLPRMITSTRHKSTEEMRQALIGANMAMASQMLPKKEPFDPELGPGALGLGEETLLGWQLTQQGCRCTLALDVEVEHHFDAGRLSREGLIGLARSKGRSMGHLQHHWLRNNESNLNLRRAIMVAKNVARTAVTPTAWPAAMLLPEWKFSYEADLARLGQLIAEQVRTPKYPGPPPA
jgi:hypothetical protein